MEHFAHLSYEQKKEKVFAMVEAIVQKSWKLNNILTLLHNVAHVSEEILYELYDAMMSFGRDMNDVEIEERFGKTQLKLQKIWEAEALDREREEKYLNSLLGSILS